MRRKRWIVGTALGASLALGGGGIALAATTGPDERGSDSSRSDGEERKAEALAEFSERLAEELGLDAAEVAEAVEAVTDELRAERVAERQEELLAWVDEALAEGRITEEEATQLRERIESGEAPGRGPGHERGFGGRGPWGVPGENVPDTDPQESQDGGSAAESGTSA